MRLRAIPASALVLAVGIAVGGCTTVADSACAAALKAKQTLEARQGKDQSSESAIDQDLTKFASALSAAAQQEKNPAAAKAMTATPQWSNRRAARRSFPP